MYAKREAFPCRRDRAMCARFSCAGQEGQAQSEGEGRAFSSRRNRLYELPAIAPVVNKFYAQA